MPSREPAMVKFNETGDCVKVGEYMVFISFKSRWWSKFFPREVRIMAYRDTGDEQRYWHGPWWMV